MPSNRRIAVNGKQSFDHQSEIDSGNTTQGSLRINCFAAYIFFVVRDTKQDGGHTDSPGPLDGSDDMGADSRDQSK